MLICVILVTQNKQTNVTTINKKYRFQAFPQSNDIIKYANRMSQKWLLLVKAWNSSESPPHSLWLKKTLTHEYLKFEPLDNILSIPPSPFAFCSHQSKCMNINT